MTLFQTGEFSLHGGASSALKIECEALTHADWKTLAELIVKRTPLDAVSTKGNPREPNRTDLEEKQMPVIQFSGETPWNALVNHHSLDLEEERELHEFCAKQKVDPETAPLAELQLAYVEWRCMTDEAYDTELT